MSVASFLLMLLTLLIHEASFIMFGPLVFIYVLFLNYKKNNNFTIRILFSLTWVLFFLVTLLISLFIAFYLPQVDLELFRYSILQRMETPDENAIKVATNKLSDNVDILFARAFTLKRLFYHLLFVPMAILTLYVFWKINGFSRRNSMDLLLFLSCLSPLLLYFIGHDHFRWWSIAVINLFILTSLLAAKPENNENFTNRLFKIRHSVSALIVMSLMLGPPRVYKGFLLGDTLLSFFNSLSQSSILKSMGFF